MNQKLKWLTKYLLAIAMLFMGIGAAHAQQVSISGNVTSSDDGYPLPGVTVIQQGTTNGTVTDMDGNYTINVPQGSVVLFSFIGMETTEITADGSKTYNVVLNPKTTGLEEVVVTALGIKREQKTLGYSMQELKGEALLESREANLTNALSGKVTGLQVIKSSNGPAGSSKIVLRGYSSLTGDNQPLIVVDGVPIDNFTGASNNDYWNPSTDMGNGLGDINPEDIASMSVLKGASAAALYGSRAGNGVILITTKTGKKRDGLGITVSSSVGFESTFISPDMQMSFGQGSDGSFDNRSNISWGPAITGQSVVKWDGTSVPMYAYDNVENFFDTGINLNNNVSFQQQINKTSLYTSVTQTNDKSMIPGAKLNRTNLMTRSMSTFGEKDNWVLDTKIQYVRSTANNRPLSGNNSSNSFRTMYLLPVSMDIRDFENASDELGNMIWYGGGNAVNPYWGEKNNLNEDTRDRFIFHGSLKYKFTDWLSMEMKGGADMYTNNTETKLYSGSPLSATGRYSLGKSTHTETNYSTLVTAQQDNVFGKFGGMVTLGGNLMEQRSSGISGSSGELEVPNLFALNNGKDKPTVRESFSHKKINSLYGLLQVNYDGYLFLEGTFRNDWSSSLHPDNRSFFYPSVNASWVITDMVNKTGGSLPSWLTFSKVRASYAEVGNDLPPYQLYNTYWIDKDPNGNTTAGVGNTLYDPSVRSELIKSYEVGIDGRFFNNRLGFDFAWYQSNATRQLINLPMDPQSGYSSKKINAGDIQNTGVELMVNGRIIDNANDGLNWDIQLNYSFNKNTIEDLYDDIQVYDLGGFDNLKILAQVGGEYGEIHGTRFLRVEDVNSPHFGKLLLTEDGLPQGTTESEKIGSQQPDALVGLTNTFSYKGFSLSFLIDGRFGGEMFSTTNQSMQAAGTAQITAPGGSREDMVLDGVIANGDGFVANDKSITAQQYWTTVTSTTGNLGIGEANIYDATNIRLRTLQLNYSLPKSLLSKTVFQRASVGFSCNNVLMIKSHMNGVDPESTFATGTNAVGFENTAPPTSRNFLFNITLGF
ncbi:SusC/RagA family TonB-linked outer membrane protein [uncultured Sunxiuqinia sp.]|uniref:SusC/RagA family TonB-linked outer membrane protein n=1 Tax=uncultured Sunxiuqinia sp. TaxID=1573825 RepID=UPI002625E0BE|nr:SusC/RagA family TonB-linked outer membrane protein [uncultured Sunxiuqinia sp.]